MDELHEQLTSFEDDLAAYYEVADHTLARLTSFPPAGTRPARPRFFTNGKVFLP